MTGDSNIWQSRKSNSSCDAEYWRALEESEIQEGINEKVYHTEVTLYRANR